MTVSATHNRNNYTANGSSCEFAYTFEITASTSLDVYRCGTLITSGYTVSGVGSASGGTVTFTTVPPANAAIVLIRDEPYTQGVDLVENSKMSADTLEDELDKLTFLIQQVKEITERAPKFSIFSCNANVKLDDVTGKAGKVLSIAASETCLEWITVSQAQAAATGSFTGSGTGATARTVSSRLGDLVSVKDYGAVGDDSTDDGAAFQYALDYLTTVGGHLYVPRGVYRIVNRRLTYSSKRALMIYGDGFSSCVVFRSLPADAPAQNKGLLNISGTGDDDASHCIGVTTRDLSFHYGGGRGDTYDGNLRGLNIYNADNIVVVATHQRGAKGELVGLGNFGSTVSPGCNAYIAYNEFTDYVQSGVNPNVFRARITQNTFTCGTIGIESGRDAPTISDNDFHDLTSYGVGLASVKNPIVTGNRFVTVATQNSGSVVGAIQVAGGGSTAPSLNGLIANNVFEFTCTTHANLVAIHFTRGTSIQDHCNFIVTGNRFSCYRFGIYANSLKRSSITGNAGVGDGSGSGVGITLTDGSARVQQNSVAGNHLYGFQTNIDHAAPATDLNEVGINYVGFASCATVYEVRGPGPANGATGRFGRELIGGTATTCTVSFPIAQPNTSYYVTATISGISGTPDNCARVIDLGSRTTTEFVMTLQKSPGAGNHVTIDWSLVR